VSCDWSEPRESALRSDRASDSDARRHIAQAHITQTNPRPRSTAPAAHPGSPRRPSVQLELRVAMPAYLLGRCVQIIFLRALYLATT